MKITFPSLEEIEQKQRNFLSGSSIDEFTDNLVWQVINAMWVKNSDPSTQKKQIQAAIAGIAGIKAQDEIEGMLAAQMVASHNAAMECFRRSMIPDQSAEIREMNLNQANKLTRSYATQMEALNRYRGKGQQKVTVEHVHVHAGGQAIVGNFTRPDGEGVIAKTEEQPYAKQIDHAPLPEMPRPHPKRRRVPIPRDA